jgi:hypothetical protein
MTMRFENEMHLFSDEAKMQIETRKSILSSKMTTTDRKKIEDEGSKNLIP